MRSLKPISRDGGLVAARRRPGRLASQRDGPERGRAESRVAADARAEHRDDAAACLTAWLLLAHKSAGFLRHKRSAKRLIMNVWTRIIVALIICTGPIGCGQAPQEPRRVDRAAFLMRSSDEPRETPSAQVRTDRERILDQVIRDVLTNPLLKGDLDDFGMRGKRIGLSSKPETAWPAKYTPDVDGYQFEYLDPDREKSRTEPPELGINLEHFVFPPPLRMPRDDLYQGYPIAVTFFNIGGRQGEGWVAANGETVYYNLHRKGGGWVVEFNGREAQ
jgi:hypothetical protein